MGGPGSGRKKGGGKGTPKNKFIKRTAPDSTRKGTN